MFRRAASGHIAATQLSKLAAASRIAAAVIRGWPEAPSSPLQGCGPLCGPLPDGGVCAGAPGVVAAVWPPLEKVPVKRLSRKFSGPPPDDCAWAWPDMSSAAAPTAAISQSLVRAVRSAMLHPHCPRNPAFRRPALVADQSTTEINNFCLLPSAGCQPFGTKPAISAFVKGRKPATTYSKISVPASSQGNLPR